MAVQAQYPSNVLLLNRSEQEKKEMDLQQGSTWLFDQSALLFPNEGNGNSRKRAREAASAMGMPMASVPQQQSHHPINLFSLQAQASPSPLPPPTFISLAQLQSQPPPLVSTGLRLVLEEGQRNQNQNQSNPILSSSSSSSTILSTLLSEELAAQVNQHNDEIEQFLHAQTEQLRRALEERRQRYFRALLSAAEESAARRLREKEAELERATRRRRELEDRLASLRTVSMAWQAKASADQTTAASLHAKLQQATAAAAAATPQAKGNECGESLPAEDAESAYVDPDRVEPERACRTCRVRPATVVLLPCRHLCICDACDGATANGSGPAEHCPVCRCVRTGSVQVFLS